MTNKKVIVLDSSQIDTFLTCPEMWQLSYRERLMPKNAQPNVPMDEGTYGHKLLEIIYKERARGNFKTDTEIAFAYDIDKETCRCSHGHDRHSDKFHNSPTCLGEHPIVCMSIGCECKEFVPVPFPLAAPEREFVRQRVREYTYAEGPVIPQLIPKSPDHVEVGFSHKLYEDDIRIYILEGRIDLLGQIASNVESGWADHKFQARQRDLYLKSIQFRNYSLVTQLSIGVINYIRLAKKVEKDKTFVRSIISFSRQEMKWWEGELIQIFNRVEKYLQYRDVCNNNSIERWNWSSCSGKFGYPCDFTTNSLQGRQGICENMLNPQYVQLIKESDYQKKAEWRPW